LQILSPQHLDLGHQLTHCLDPLLGLGGGVAGLLGALPIFLQIRLGLGQAVVKLLHPPLGRFEETAFLGGLLLGAEGHSTDVFHTGSHLLQQILHVGQGTLKFLTDFLCRLGGARAGGNGSLDFLDDPLRFGQTLGELVQELRAASAALAACSARSASMALALCPATSAALGCASLASLASLAAFEAIWLAFTFVLQKPAAGLKRGSFRLADSAVLISRMFTRSSIVTRDS